MPLLADQNSPRNSATTFKLFTAAKLAFLANSLLITVVSTFLQKLPLKERFSDIYQLREGTAMLSADLCKHVSSLGHQCAKAETVHEAVKSASKKRRETKAQYFLSWRKETIT